MSFIDLATLAMHRRNEMESRINVFVSKCDDAVEDIEKIKLKAQGFVHQLNCDPSELKERFLNCMKTLDEYIYLITDFNLSVSKLEQCTGALDNIPVHDTTPLRQPLLPTPTYNLFDMLSEPIPSTSTVCPNNCPIKHKIKKVPKNEQTLIEFSSSSSSAESVPQKAAEKKEQEIQCKLAGEFKDFSVLERSSSSERHNLPAQAVLQVDHVYPGNIMSIDGHSLWIIIEDLQPVLDLITEMTVYYKKHHVTMSIEDITMLTYCSMYDEETDSYYRGLFIRLAEADPSTAEVFLVDTGEVRTVNARAALQPLHVQFCAFPPFARCCHLAGVEMNYEDKKVLKQQEEFLSQYCAMPCTVKVDDNASESLGVYVILPEEVKGITLNELMVKEGLAISIEKTTQAIEAVLCSALSGPPASSKSSDLDMAACPEYEDALEAVTGYSCRDEADICKHYKGGPEKTCFKGAKCTKRHVLKHPEGWTLDRVEVPVRVRAPRLPAPDEWLRVRVSCVAHFDRVYVQVVSEDPPLDEPLPEFGEIRPHNTLEALIRDMNSPAQRTAYKPLKLVPAPGELVAAIYPPDNQWYRARIRTIVRPDQNVEVEYIDYGNVMWVKEDCIRALEPRFTSLPTQALLCVLAGAAAAADEPTRWTAARHQLDALTLNRLLDAHVIARDFEEVTIELFDEEGYSIAKQLAARNLIKLNSYSVVFDDKTTKKIVVP